MKKQLLALVFGCLSTTLFVNAQTPCTTCGDPVVAGTHHSVEVPGGKIYEFISDGKNFSVLKNGKIEKITTGIEQWAKPVAVTKPTAPDGLRTVKEIEYIILVFEDITGRSYNAYYNIKQDGVIATAGF